MTSYRIGCLVCTRPEPIAAQINHSAQLTLDTYRQLLGVLESRLATDGVWEVLTEDDRDELEEWRIVFQRRANEKGQT